MTLVLVTGASGFLAQHVILKLLAKGYEVRGTLRSLSKADSVRAVLAKHDPRAAAIQFVEADLEKDAGWAEAAAGCTYVQHIASPFPAVHPKDENELIRPARDGALRALKAAKAAGVKRVVVTMEHTAKGAPKLVRDCTLPLTGRRCVDMVITELGVFEMDRSKRRFAITELAPGVTVEEVRSKSEAELIAPANIRIVQC